MILKDLRISPLRNILTGISMFVGIIAMISSVLVGTLGKEYLISVNAQMYGWSPTYSFSITGSDFQDTSDMLPPLKSLILKWGLLAQWLY